MRPAQAHFCGCRSRRKRGLKVPSRRSQALGAIETEINGAGGGVEIDRSTMTISATSSTTTASESGLALAIGYSLLRWQALALYRDGGRIEMDNNAAERALCGLALEAATVCSWGRTPAGIVRGQFIVWWRRPSSMG